MQNALKILPLFLEIIIFQIDNSGKILKTVLNTKKDFKTTKLKTIFSLFSQKEHFRLQRLLESGFQIKKRNMKLNKNTGFDEYVDVEIAVNSSEIFLSLQFPDSQLKKEVFYDRHVEKLAALSGKDPMTKVFNRQGFEERFLRLIKNSDLKKRIGFLYIDMDNLKEINDKYGHVVGDKAILNIIEILSSTVRERDLIARFGGDEFLVVVEEITGEKSTVYGLSKRLLELIGRNKKRKCLTTVSLGVHIFEAGKLKKYVGNFLEFRKACAKEIDCADKATYSAKKAGKNRIAVSQDYKKFYN